VKNVVISSSMSLSLFVKSFSFDSGVRFDLLLTSEAYVLFISPSQLRFHLEAHSAVYYVVLQNAFFFLLLGSFFLVS